MPDILTVKFKATVCRDTSDWLQTIPTGKTCICESVCAGGVIKVSQRNAVEFTNGKQFVNARSTVCI